MIRYALAGLIVCLLIIGAVSGTPLRHVIQAVPAVVTLAALLRDRARASAAAIPVFAFWLFIAMAIWMHLAGIADIVAGPFSDAEIACTGGLAAAAALGLPAAIRASSRGAVMKPVLGGAVAQVAAMWLSLQPPIAGR